VLARTALVRQINWKTTQQGVSQSDGSSPAANEQDHLHPNPFNRINVSVLPHVKMRA
jgi:hypothetical protein